MRRLAPSPRPSSRTASRTAAPMSSESSLCLGPPGKPACGAPKSSGLTVNSACGTLVRESWQRGTSTALAWGTSGPSMRLRGIALRSWAMRLRSAGLSNPPVYPAAALPASTAKGRVAIVAPRVLHGRTAAAGGDVRQAFAAESGDETARFEADATLRAARDACLANMSRGLIGARRVLGCRVPRSAFTRWARANTPPPKVCDIPLSSAANTTHGDGETPPRNARTASDLFGAISRVD
mmetsp:Transcript_740/g.3145  ORF Transcript_740/g.3145 Transcript_740/m.3145 type:complete len:238 (-) Transcript_740:66-779(-)